MKKTNIKLLKKEPLGKGAFGVVYLVERNGKKLAMKIVNNDGHASLESQIKEIELIKRISSFPNCVDNVSCYFAHNLVYKDNYRKDHYRIHDEVMDDPRYTLINVIVYSVYIEGKELAKRIEDLKNTGQIIKGNFLFKWMFQGYRALAKLHERNIFHSDIKPSNIMIDEKGDLYLIDFGLSCFIDPFGRDRDRMTGDDLKCTQNIASTPAYLPKYVLDESSYNSLVRQDPNFRFKIRDLSEFRKPGTGLSDLFKKIDVYALSVSFYELITGRMYIHDEYRNINMLPLYNNYVNKHLTDKYLTYTVKLGIDGVKSADFIYKDLREEDHYILEYGGITYNRLDAYLTIIFFGGAEYNSIEFYSPRRELQETLKKVLDKYLGL